MSDVGKDLTGLNKPFVGSLTFDDTASSVLPSGSSFAPGIYKPTNYGDDDNFPAPAPTGSYQSPSPAGTATLGSTFNGTDPNGTWSLYLISPTVGASIADGWTLTIETDQCASITIQSEQLPAGISGVNYNTKLSATGGTEPYNFSLPGGNLPSGLSLSGDGTLSGTPTQVGNFLLNILATDFNGCTEEHEYTLLVEQGAITLNPSDLAGGAVGLNYTATFSALNAAAPLHFSLTGTLPAGLNFSDAMISGTPTEGGSFPIRITVEDANGVSASRDYTLIINRPPLLSTISDQAATRNKLLTFTALAEDPDAPPQSLTFSLVDAPTGASIDATSGVFTWTPTGTQLGTFTFTLRAFDSGSPSLSAVQTIRVIVGAGASVLTIANTTPDTNFSSSTNGLYVLRYNVTAIDGLLNSANGFMRVRVRDQGPGANVTVSLRRTNAEMGGNEHIVTFDSDTMSPGSGFHTPADVLFTHRFDFTNYVYWLEVTLKKMDDTGAPGFGGVAIGTL
jgi:hypothetical protein